jgi:hypothetical protein
MPNPVALDVFDRTWPELRRRRANARVQFLFMGGDFPRKGGYDLLDAWVEGEFARPRRSDHRQRLADQALPFRRRSHNVRGVRTQTPEWSDVWRSADVFVMPTRNEAFGLRIRKPPPPRFDDQFLG